MAYNGGPAINVPNMVPSNSPFATKTFTVTGNNVTTSTMRYNLSLKINSNTFSYHALQFKLISTNTGSNGSVAPSITNLMGVGSGSREIFLGNAHFTGTSGQNKVHTYSLELYFPLTGQDQSYDTGKSFNAKIEIKEGIGTAITNYLNDSLINQFGLSNITNAPAGTFRHVSGASDNKMHKMPDDYGMSYYLRGSKNNLKNNLIFGGFQWKIVRINGNGSIRIIYNGTCPNNNCSMNTTGTSTQMGASAFNTNFQDNRYIGYMYGPGTNSYPITHSNQNNSTIKSYLENWYNSNIKNTNYESKVDDVLFCGDREVQTGSGIGTTRTTYKTGYRIGTNFASSLKCTLKNDRFTVSDAVVGNGRLSNPIGLLSSDEGSLAGLVSGINNTSNYLYTAQNFWTLSPAHYTNRAGVYQVSSTGRLLTIVNVNISHGVRGVLNLKPDTRVSGSGTLLDPYKVIT